MDRYLSISRKLAFKQAADENTTSSSRCSRAKLRAANSSEMCASDIVSRVVCLGRAYAKEYAKLVVSNKKITRKKERRIGKESVVRKQYKQR